jgi:hypothetical protein
VPGNGVARAGAQGILRAMRFTDVMETRQSPVPGAKPDSLLERNVP